jgi:NADH-quinone oxidoreductase subunit L
MMPAIERVLLAASIGLPFLAVLVLSLGAWLARKWPEAVIHRLATWALLLSFTCNGALGVGVVLRGGQPVAWSLPGWFGVGQYHFPLALVADGLSAPFAIFASGLLVITSKFSSGYLHREPGFLRYYLLLCLFGGAVELALLAGSLDFLLFGWELVGFTSVLLIAFFHERAAPVSHGLRTFVVYRVCDVGLLGAAVWLHHSAHGTTAQTGLLTSWWGVQVPPRAGDALLVGLLLIWASLGKGAQVPFGGWLPRAMEGPTPSSAIFYGALSVHLGPYLLLRAAPLLDAQPILAAVVVLVGFATAVHGTVVGRVQSDIKCALAYASMTQVGVILVEIGLGFRALAIVHIVGHAALRCLQFLRAPSVLSDRAEDERLAGAPLHQRPGPLEHRLPASMRAWLYRGALERGFLDALLRDYLLAPIIQLSRRLDHAQESLHGLLAGRTALSPEEAGRKKAEVEAMR